MAISHPSTVELDGAAHAPPIVVLVAVLATTATAMTKPTMAEDATATPAMAAVLMPAIRKDHAFFKSRGLIEVDVQPEAVIDNSFVEASLKQLGPYKKGG